MLWSEGSVVGRSNGDSTDHYGARQTESRRRVAQSPMATSPMQHDASTIAKHLAMCTELARGSQCHVTGLRFILLWGEHVARAAVTMAVDHWPHMSSANGIGRRKRDGTTRSLQVKSWKSSFHNPLRISQLSPLTLDSPSLCLIDRLMDVNH